MNEASLLDNYLRIIVSEVGEIIPHTAKSCQRQKSEVYMWTLKKHIKFNIQEANDGVRIRRDAI